MIGQQEAYATWHPAQLGDPQEKSCEILCIHIENKTTAISGQLVIKQCNAIDIELGKKDIYKRSKKY